MAPPVDFSGFDAPPLRLFIGQNRWCNSTSSPWQRKTGGERDGSGVGGRGHDTGKAVEALSFLFPTTLTSPAPFPTTFTPLLRISQKT